MSRVRSNLRSVATNAPDPSRSVQLQGPSDCPARSIQTSSRYFVDAERISDRGASCPCVWAMSTTEPQQINDAVTADQRRSPPAGPGRHNATRSGRTDRSLHPPHEDAKRTMLRSSARAHAAAVLLAVNREALVSGDFGARRQLPDCGVRTWIRRADRSATGFQGRQTAQLLRKAGYLVLASERRRHSGKPRTGGPHTDRWPSMLCDDCAEPAPKMPRGPFQFILHFESRTYWTDP